MEVAVLGLLQGGVGDDAVAFVGEDGGGGGGLVALDVLAVH